MEKTLFYQIFEWINDLKKSGKKTVKVTEISERLESLVKDKLTVDLQIDQDPIKLEGLTQTQADTISLIFQSYVREFENKQRTIENNGGFELVADWNDATVKTEKKKTTKRTADKTKKIEKFRGKIVASPQPTNTPKKN